MVQMYAAMTALGLTPSKMQKMKEPAHVFEFIKATLASAIMDGKQTPYYSDYVLQSVQRVEVRLYSFFFLLLLLPVFFFSHSPTFSHLN